ncbi:13489_t:CDS:2, partial [Funneliformis mosseae]
MKFLLLTVVICLIYALVTSPLIEGEEGEEDQDAFQRIAAVPTVHAVMDLHVPT